ncbi:hypothetical protein PZ897_18375 [Hoeflea sp. YIM 152468]|uniref:hypothetical protein n=1 Tax=Hoeflea sp. YIM 152468 TaxID=3031759 RepID=UPI0023DBB1F4|nr:hypothetical protein [Hoeflea sp. YIM 152468]MDF1610153.1 hypothetical protein [Hoeflea sp. YIM 152468]
MALLRPHGQMELARAGEADSRASNATAMAGAARKNLYNRSILDKTMVIYGISQGRQNGIFENSGQETLDGLS